MSNTVKLVVALALTAVTATGALAASRHKGVYPRAYSGYACAGFQCLSEYLRRLSQSSRANPWMDLRAPAVLGKLQLFQPV